jgi:hypothetical protein
MSDLCKQNIKLTAHHQFLFSPLSPHSLFRQSTPALLLLHFFGIPVCKTKWLQKSFFFIHSQPLFQLKSNLAIGLITFFFLSILFVGFFLLLWIIHGTGYYIVFLSVFLLPLTLYTFTQLDTQQRKSMATELEELLGFLSSPSPQVSSSYSFTWKKQIITNILNHNFLLLYRLQRQLLILFED